MNGTIKNGYIASENGVRNRQITNHHKTEHKHLTSSKGNPNTDEGIFSLGCTLSFQKSFNCQLRLIVLAPSDLQQLFF